MTQEEGADITGMTILRKNSVLSKIWATTIYKSSNRSKSLWDIKFFDY